MAISLCVEIHGNHFPVGIRIDQRMQQDAAAVVPEVGTHTAAVDAAGAVERTDHEMRIVPAVQAVRYQRTVV